jgi:hypothetical protein
VTTLEAVRTALVAIAVFGCAAPPSGSPDAAMPSTAPGASRSAAPIGDDAPIGSWTMTLTGDDLRAAGFTETGLVSENVGAFTFTVQPDGTWTMAQATPQPVRWPVFRGTYSVTAPGTLEMRTTFPSDYAGEVVTVAWSRGDDGLRLHVLSPPDPLLRVQLETHPWAPSP